MGFHSRGESCGFTDLGYAKADTARAERQGAGEVVYGEGKNAVQIAEIICALMGGGQPRVLVTRLDGAKAADVARLLEGSTARGGSSASADGASEARAARGQLLSGASLPFEYFPDARLGVAGGFAEPDGDGVVAVLAAGTSDLSVAEEAALTAEFLGNEVVRIYDVGVAGVHRLLAYEDELRRARVVVAVAGMEGALPSVVGGLVKSPVLAVPTSVGYGASFGGVTALLAMLNSCASGVSVVNIDNGFGAGYQASLINHLGSAEYGR